MVPCTPGRQQAVRWEACRATKAQMAGTRSCLALQMGRLSGLQVRYGRAKRFSCERCMGVHVQCPMSQTLLATAVQPVRCKACRTASWEGLASSKELGCMCQS